MVVALFAVSFALALALSVGIAWISREAINSILRRFVADPIVRAGFGKYLQFVIVVVGIAAGTRTGILQDYLAAPTRDQAALAAKLTQEFWIMQIYQTIIGSVEGVAWLLLVCIFIALITSVIVRMFKLQPAATRDEQQEGDSPERRIFPIRRN